MENKETSRASELQQALLCEAVALNQNRILLRLRSRHATSRANFKKDKKQRPKLIPQLCEAINKPILEGTARVSSPVFVALKADIQRLGRLFESLEHLSTPEAKSRLGLEILVDIVTSCQHVHNHRILEDTLTGIPRLEAVSKATIARTITKLGHYSTVSHSLLQVARNHPIFERVRISIVKFRAPKVASTELDRETKDFVHALVNQPGFRKLTSRYPDPSLSEIEDHIRREATIAIPVHAEIQLLFYYEWNPCSLPPRIICSSKQACFLCNLFLRIHGKFAVPNTHGRMYEKWALPSEIQKNRKANGNILTKCREFVSTIENALQMELQSFRKPYPAPHESMILNSVAGSQTNSSRISAHDFPPSQRTGLCERPLSILSKETLSPKGSHLVHIEEAATTTAAVDESQIDADFPHSETSSTLTAYAPPSPAIAPQSIDRHDRKTDANNSPVLLTRGLPIWCEISSNTTSLKVRTPRVHLTISRDEDIQSDLCPDWDHYWVLLEYLSDHSFQDAQNVPAVDLLAIQIGHNMILDYDNSEKLRRLRVYSKSDVISVTYSLEKPIDGVEYRACLEKACTS